MNKSLKTICSLVLVLVLLFGVSQVRATTLQDEGTEGKAYEYWPPSGFGGYRFDEQYYTQVGSYSLELKADLDNSKTTVAMRPLSSSFEWGDYETGEVQIYKRHGSAGQLQLKLVTTSSPYSEGVTWDLDLDTQEGHTQKTYTLSRASARPSYGGVEDEDTLTHMMWYWHTNNNNPGDIIYIDGYNITLSTGGGCLGTLMVSALTVIALIGVRLQGRKTKK